MSETTTTPTDQKCERVLQLKDSPVCGGAIQVITIEKIPDNSEKPETVVDADHCTRCGKILNVTETPIPTTE
jgi:hypothetical protein